MQPTLKSFGVLAHTTEIYRKPHSQKRNLLAGLKWVIHSSNYVFDTVLRLWIPCFRNQTVDPVRPTP